MATKAGSKFLNAVFRRSKDATGGSVETRPAFPFDSALSQMLCSQCDTASRIKTIRDLKTDLVDFRLEEDQINTIYSLTNDLLSPAHSKENRDEVLDFYVVLVTNQLEQLGLARVHFFRLVEWHKTEIPQRLRLLQALTKEGKCIVRFEREAPKFIAKWMHDVLQTSQTSGYLKLVINLVKFNSAFLDREIIHKFIEETCTLCYHTKAESNVKLGLELLDCLVSYSLLRTEVLEFIIPTVCRTVLVESLLNSSKLLMTKLIGTHLGRAAISKMCQIIEEPDKYGDAKLLRGAVVFLGMAMCPSKAHTDLTFPSSNTAILVAMSKVLGSEHTVITAEVCRALKLLIESNKAKNTCGDLTWSLIFDIIINVLNGFDQTKNEQHPEKDACVNLLSELIVTLEQLADDKVICGTDRDRLFEIVELSPHHQRSEASMLRLIQYRAGFVQRHSGDWLGQLASIMDKFYRNSPQTLRLKALCVLKEVIVVCGAFYDEQICEKIIQPYLGSVSEEKDEIVACETLRVVAALPQMSSLPSKKTKEACVDIIETVLNQPINSVTPVAIECLCGIFRNEMNSCNPHPMNKILSKLVEWINRQYCPPSGEVASPLNTSNSVRSRQLVIELFLSFRMNSRNQLGIEVVRDGHFVVDYAPLVFTVASGYTERLISQGLELVILPLMPAMPSIAAALQSEPNWGVFSGILERIPRFLQDRQLMVVSNAPVAKYCQCLCSIAAEKRRHEDFQGEGITLSELQQKTFPTLVVFTIHKGELQPTLQKGLISSLIVGMSSKAAQICIRSLTLVLLQMQDQMYKSAEAVLNKLAQVSDTKAVALPVLDFLSSLITLPEIFSSFTKDFYNKVFAIALPYTNSVKFSRYTVALAHHVIALWFLKCKPEFRPEFAKFIMKRLRNFSSRTAVVESQPTPQSFEPVQRSRSGSLNERKGNTTPKEVTKDSGLMSLQDELVEACDDFLNQYSQGACSLQPRKSAAEKFLVKGGQSVTWVCGNKLLTITTSGCTSNTPLNTAGVCDKCLKLCKSANNSSLNLSSSESLTPSSPPVAADLTPNSKKKVTLNDLAPRSMSVASRDDLNFMKRNPDLSGSQSNQIKCSSDEHIYSSGNHSHNQHSALTSSHHHSCQGIHASNESMSGSGSGSTVVLNRVCNCWCRNWAEVTIRRPSGVTSWTLRLQNELYSTMLIHDVAIPDITSIFNNLSVISHESSDILQQSTSEKSEDSPTLKSAPSSPTEPAPKPLIQRSVSMTEKERSKKSPRNEKYASIPEEPKSKRTSLAVEHQEFSYNSSALDSSFRDRARTISVMTPTRTEFNLWKETELNYTDRACLSPMFLFSRLFQEESKDQSNPAHRSISVPADQMTHVEMLDNILAYETHKIGVLYIDADQPHEEARILSNVFGSRRYMKFLQGLGSYVCLKDIHNAFIYHGGLSTQYGEDGDFSISWHDDVMQVMFHVATLMPNKESDPNCHQKKLHVGNDFVVIVYNNSNEDYIPPQKSQFLHACIIISPQQQNTSLVKLWIRKELQNDVGYEEELIKGHCIQDDALPKYARQLALHMNIAARIHREGETYVNNWLERLRAIKRLRERLLQKVSLFDFNPGHSHN